MPIPLLIPSLVELGTSLIDRIFPDPEKANDAKLKLLELQQTGELKELDANLQLALAQAATNTAEATNNSLFVSGWRPFIGWVCGAALFCRYIGGPVLAMLLEGFGVKVDLPPIDWSDLMPLMLGMLGLGGMRTYEKVKGVQGDGK